MMLSIDSSRRWNRIGETKMKAKLSQLYIIFAIYAN